MIVFAYRQKTPATSPIVSVAAIRMVPRKTSMPSVGYAGRPEVQWPLKPIGGRLPDDIPFR
jgi:hypothetical protein